MTSFWRNSDVIIALRVCWGISYASLNIRKIAPGHENQNNSTNKCWIMENIEIIDDHFEYFIFSKPHESGVVRFTILWNNGDEKNHRPISVCFNKVPRYLKVRYPNYHISCCVFSDFLRRWEHACCWQLGTTHHILHVHSSSNSGEPIPRQCHQCRNQNCRSR